jgi:hypothetical protein
MKTKTWIVCIENKSAQIFARDEKKGADQLCYTINSSHRSKNGFLKYIAEEMELACGWGTNNNLVIQGEQGLVKRITELCSYEVRGSIRRPAFAGA